MLTHKLKNKEIILASASPRRQELLKGMDIPYRLADRYEVDEVYPEETAPSDVSRYLAELKAKNYPAPLKEHQILITADTVVILDGEVLGKPRDRAEALEMIGKLSGKRHEVITGVTLRDTKGLKSFSCSSLIDFRTLETEEIVYYTDRYKPFDKAGSYGIQEWIGYIGIDRIEGSFYNVMGLPTRRLYTELTEFIQR